MGTGGGETAAVRVLVVDDSPVDRRIVELLLRNHKGGATAFHVTAVDSGKKAMELLGSFKEEAKPGSSAPADANEQSIDIVLTDYCMPEMTGYDLLKAIKALSSPNPIPVVVMSSENEPQRISRCLTAGAEDFILKPLKMKDVHRLRNCSTAKPVKAAEAEAEAAAGARRRSSRKRNNVPLHQDHVAKKATSEQRPHQLAGLAMVLNASSSIELSHYFQLLFKFILLAYAVVYLGELLHRWSINGCLLSLW